jgi:hypothetical protein
MDTRCADGKRRCAADSGLRTACGDTGLTYNSTTLRSDIGGDCAVNTDLFKSSGFAVRHGGHRGGDGCGWRALDNGCAVWGSLCAAGTRSRATFRALSNCQMTDWGRDRRERRNNNMMWEQNKTN